MTVLVRLPLLLALLVAAALLPGSARAGEAEDALVPQEREVLRRTFPGWEDLSAERRERIARNVLHLRRLSPEERARFVRRVRELETRKLDAERLEKVRGFSGDPKAAKWRLQALLAAALGRAVSAEVARDVAPDRVPPPPVVGLAFHRALQQQVAKDESDEGRSREYEPSPEGRARYEELKARTEAEAAKDLRRFVFEDRTKRWLRDALAGATPGADVAATASRLEGVVARLRETYPRAFEATLGVARTNRESFLQRFGPKPEEPARGRRFEARRAALHYLAFLERAAPFLVRDPEARERAEALLAWLFVKGMGVPQAEWDRLPSWDRPAERVRALRRMMAR